MVVCFLYCHALKHDHPASYPICTHVGEIMEHPGNFNTYRVGSEEKRAQERSMEDIYDKVRQAAEVQRQVIDY